MLKHLASVTAARLGGSCLCVLLSSPAFGAWASDDALRAGRDKSQTGEHGEAQAILEAQLPSPPVGAKSVAAAPAAEPQPDSTQGAIIQAMTLAAQGRGQQARDVINSVLAREPGNEEARALRERLDVSLRPWASTFSTSIDSFDDGRDAWRETGFALARLTPAGPLVVRARRAARLGLSDSEAEVEMHPRLRPTTQATLVVGGGGRSGLYPKAHFGGDLHHAFGHGFSASGGWRRLAFEQRAVDVYAATLTRFLGNWMVAGGTVTVTGDAGQGSNAFNAHVRRYFGHDGTSYAGVAYGLGVAREELLSTADLLRLNSNAIRGELDTLVTSHLRLSVAGGMTMHTHQWGAVRQTSLTLGVGMVF